MTRKLLRYLGLATLLLCAVQLGLAQSQIAVTGHIAAAGPNPSNPTIYQVQFTLAYCGANVPRIFGTGTIAASTATYTADSTGLIAGTIWPNDVITCGGVMGNTRYNVSFVTNGSRVGPTQCFDVIGAGPFNLDTAQPCVIVPPPIPPPGTQDAHVFNLTVDGLLAGVNAIFSGDVTALSFHFSTAGNHFACPGGQFANALKQDFTFGCAAPASAPVSSVFGRTGLVVAALNDYNFNLLAGTIADGQFLALTHVYPIQVTEAVHLTGTPTHTSCDVVSGQAIVSISIDSAANLTCTKAAIPTQMVEAMTIAGCSAAAGTYETCSLPNNVWPIPFTSAYSMACTAQDANAGPGSSTNESGTVYTDNVTLTQFDVWVQNNRGSFVFAPTNIRCVAISHP